MANVGMASKIDAMTSAHEAGQDWRALLRLRAAENHGVLFGHDLAGLATTRAGLRHELAGVGWDRAGRNVWTVAGSVATDEQHALVALAHCGPGAALTGTSAAALWGLPGFRLLPVEAARIRGGYGSTPAGVTLHRPRRLPADQITSLRGLPIVGPDLVLIHLAASLHPGRVERCMDQMWSDRLISGRSLDRTLRQMSAKGRSGVGVVRRLFDQRGPAWIPPASGLESRVDQLLTQNGIDGFARQVDVGGAEEWIGRVDFRHVKRPVVIEVQSERYHAALSFWRADRVRLERMRAEGLTVVEVWEHEVWHAPTTWLERVRDALRRT